MRVYLDGAVVNDCHVADEEAGYVIMTARDERGNIIHDDQQIKVVKREGRVVIDLDDAQAQ